ncbi:hypothetical protein Tco_0273008 [Tanacetum coccineum]
MHHHLPSFNQDFTISDDIAKENQRSVATASASENKGPVNERAIAVFPSSLNKSTVPSFDNAVLFSSNCCNLSMKSSLDKCEEINENSGVSSLDLKK